MSSPSKLPEGTQNATKKSKKETARQKIKKIQECHSTFSKDFKHLNEMAEMFEKFRSDYGSTSRPTPSTSSKTKYPLGESMSTTNHYTFSTSGEYQPHIEVNVTLFMPPGNVVKPGQVIYVSSTQCETMGVGGHQWGDADYDIRRACCSMQFYAVLFLVWSFHLLIR